MTRQEFIDILDKAGVEYETDSRGVIYIDGVYILGSSLAYVRPGDLFVFNTDTTQTSLEDLKPKDLEPMIAHYRKFHPKEADDADMVNAKEADNTDMEPSGDAYVTVNKEEWEQLKAENARLKAVLERHGIKLLK